MIHLEIDMPVPTADEIRTARTAVGLTMREACDLADIAHQPRWAEYEAGRRNMTAARWLMFLLRTDQHPTYQLVKRPSAL